jgi:hypothetical protein
MHARESGGVRTKQCSCTLTAKTTGKGKILGLDGDTLGVDGRQIRVLEQRHKVRLRRLLQRHHRRGLEPKVRLDESSASSYSAFKPPPAHLKVLRNLAHQPLERQLPDKQLRRLLVPTNLPQRDRTRAETMRLLHTAGRRRSRLLRRGLCGLGRDGLAGRFA